VRLKATAHPGEDFVILLAQSDRPGFEYGTRHVPLALDSVLAWSVLNPVVGQLDNKGEAIVALSIPPQLWNGSNEIYACWFGLDLAAPYGVQSISNALRIR